MQFHPLIPTAALAVIVFGQAAPLRAVPVLGQYIEDARCDAIANQTLTDELGRLNPFPLNEGLLVSVQPATFTVCVPDDGIANDWLVRIQNVSGVLWQDLFFVADLGVSFGNADGRVVDLLGAPGVLTDAMRIDGTVTPGMNANLLSESINANEIFELNEVWEFTVSNFVLPAALNNPPLLVTPGVFAGSSAVGLSKGNASILANPVPEPGAVGALVLGAGLGLLRRRRRDTSAR